MNKYLFDGIPICFNNEHFYFDFRKKIADHFDISHRDIFIVGSAKMGFSYYKETLFSYESDVDVAIINEELFNKYLRYIIDFQYNVETQKIILDQTEEKKYNKFKNYLIKGWLRPDLIPIKGEILNKLKEEWFDFFKSISYGKSEVGDYKVAAGLFKDDFCAEKYYSVELLNKKITLEIEE